MNEETDDVSVDFALLTNSSNWSILSTAVSWHETMHVKRYQCILTVYTDGRREYPSFERINS